MKKYRHIFRRLPAIFIIVIFTASCSDWLTVKPEDQMLETDAFSSETNINKVLNGIYLKMADRNLYGYDMTFGVIESMAQYYWLSVGSSYKTHYHLQQFNYSESGARSRLDDIWYAAYSTIFDINLFISNLELSDVLSPDKKNILMGEALALRAYIHLDMLRLFGPVYSKNPQALSVPYYLIAGSHSRPRKPAQDVMKMVLEDIDAALILLADDPVIGKGPMVDEEYSGDFYTYRNRRMNYYAVKALKARALMFTGEEVRRAEASRLAREVLDSRGFDEYFPWWNQGEIEDPKKPDRVGSSEVLFGIHSPQMYKTWNDNLSPGIQDVEGLLSVHLDLIAYLLDERDISRSSDMRSRNLVAHQKPDWTVMLKYSPTNGIHANFQPLIRKTELYYYIAEVEEDYDILNEVLTNRVRMGVYSDIDVHLEREWYSEFYGEGQLFFYLKRRGLSSIRTNQNGRRSMTDTEWQPSLPERELDQ